MWSYPSLLYQQLGFEAHRPAQEMKKLTGQGVKIHQPIYAKGTEDTDYPHIRPKAAKYSLHFWKASSSFGILNRKMEEAGSGHHPGIADLDRREKYSHSRLKGLPSSSLARQHTISCESSPLYPLLSSKQLYLLCVQERETFTLQLGHGGMHCHKTLLLYLELRWKKKTLSSQPSAGSFRFGKRIGEETKEEPPWLHVPHIMLFLGSQFYQLYGRKHNRKVKIGKRYIHRLNKEKEKNRYHKKKTGHHQTE